MASPPLHQMESSDKIINSSELEYFRRWLHDRIETDHIRNDALPPRWTICNGNGLFRGWQRRSAQNEILYDLSVVFKYSLGTGCPRFMETFMKLLSDKKYVGNYSGMYQNTIFPLLGNLYCLDRPGETRSSAFRINESNIPNDLIPKRQSIIFPISSDVEFRSRLPNCQYDDSVVYIVDYASSSIPSEGLRVKITDNPENSEEQKKIYEEYYKKNFSGVNIRWYKIGDMFPFTTVSHKIINIVLPDKEDSRIVHRKNNDGSITELKCRLIGWVELDPTPIPINKN
jgi:hypothetical protein